MRQLFFSREEQEHAPAVPLRTDLAMAHIFGCGMVGKMMFRHLHAAGLPALGFVDNNPALWGGDMLGAPVLSPAAYAALPGEKTLIVAVGRGVDDVLRQCEELGARRVIPFYQVLKTLKILPYEKQMSAMEIENDEQARAALYLWDDEGSRLVYRQALRFHALQDFREAPPSTPVEYFSPDYMPARFLRSFVDGGAFNGDTFLLFRETTNDAFENYYGFEPDAHNFQDLRATAGPDNDRVHLFNIGLGDSPRDCAMNAAGDFASRIVDGGEVSIRIDSLDNTLPDRPVTMVKLDIEGFEENALIGMEQTLRRQRPALAISVYHVIDHAWRLPLWVANLNLGYRFRLGFHGSTYGGAVCYAVPDSNFS